MSKLAVVLPLAIGLVFYLYCVWDLPNREWRSARHMSIAAGWMSVLAGGCVGYACFWGAAHGFSPYQILFGELPPQKFGNFAYTARTVVVVATLFCAHALVAFVLRRNGVAGNDS